MPPLEQLHVSAVTLAEIGFGIERAADARRCARLHGWLTHPLRTLCAARVPLCNPWDAIA